MAKMGRPLKPIDKEEFEKLCHIQCTEVEICGWFDVCEDTLNKWCKKNYKLTFSEISRQKRQTGKISLRRSQFQAANGGNISMLIWLGKQYLGQADKQEVNQKNKTEINPSDISLLHEYIKKES